MKPYKELTRLGRLRRLRAVAEQALDAYGLSCSRLKFLCYNGNVIYRADTSKSAATHTGAGPFAPNGYVLRVHMVYHSLAAIRSELQWLSALRRDAGLSVPEPVPTRNGRFVTEIEVRGLPESRKVTMLRWLKGSFLTNKLGSRQVRAWGRLMAELHNHASKWKPPQDFIRRHRDWDGLFGENAGFEFPVGELYDAIPARFRDAYDEVKRQSKKIMKKLGTRSDAFGLVHADLDVNTNILFGRGEARAIDFDDCCFAYWLHDLAFALAPWQGKAEELWIEKELLEGYSRVRTFPNSQLKHLELFKAIFNANLMLWMIDWQKLSPNSTEARKSVLKYGGNMMRFFDPDESE